MTDEPPNRALGGGNIRQAHLFEALAQVFPTDLLVAGQGTDERVRAAAAHVFEVPERTRRALERLEGSRLLPLGVMLASRYPQRIFPARAARQALGRRLSEAAGGYDLVCVEHAALAPLLPASRTCPWVITLHHLLSGMLETERELAPGRRQRWFRAVDLRKARHLERQTLSRSDRCLVCSDVDAASLVAAGGPTAAEHVRVIANGVDLDLYPSSPVPSEPTVLIPGTLGWSPNVDGVKWFCAEAWPLIRAAVPDASLTIAGRSPVAEVLELGRLPGVTVAADVPSMIPYLQAARVIVVPLRMGTGTRLKALEGMAARRPVIGTTVGLEGIDVEDGVQVAIADDGTSMAEAVTAILENDDLARSLARSGRAHVQERFDWKRIGEQFVDTISELLDSPARPYAGDRSSSRAA